MPADIRLQIVSPCIRPPDGEGWLHEIKHDGHRLVAIVPSRGQLKLLSRNGHDRTPLFRVPFRKLALSGRPLVLDGEIAVPDERGVTHIDLLQAASGRYGADRLTYFAFDLLHLDGHDLRRCPIEARKALLRRLVDEAGDERLVFVDHIIGRGAELFGPYPGNRGRGDRLEAARECRAPKVFRTCSMRSRYRACGAGGASTILMERARAARA